jgi:FtsP/CotA-like multicopper oxidase with cupredoxin domain
LINRRNFIKAGVAGIAGSACLQLVQANSQRPEFRLNASPGQVNFSADQKIATRVMHYNQSIPGPVLRLPQGQESVIRFENSLDETSSVHWRDTALFTRGEQGTMRFIADNPGKWLIHCHMVEHMAGGMVTWFEVS